jgi:uncharacterized membrane protein
MNILSPALISFWFKYLVIASIIWFILMLLRPRSIDKRIKALLELPDNRKEKIISLYGKSISMYRMFLWITPFGFLLSLAALGLLFVFPEMALAFPDFDIRQLVLLMGLSLIVAYIHVVEDSYYKKKILKAIDKSVEREMP